MSQCAASRQERTEALQTLSLSTRASLELQQIPMESQTRGCDPITGDKNTAMNARCVDKVMMEEKVEWEVVVNCEHSYDKRCAKTLKTNYKPFQVCASPNTKTYQKINSVSHSRRRSAERAT